MKFDKNSAVAAAKADLAKRLDVSEKAIKEIAITETDFPDMSLGAPASGEVSAQMISTGWRINFESGGEEFEYRADKYQLRLYQFRGTSYVIKS